MREARFEKRDGKGTWDKKKPVNKERGEGTRDWDLPEGTRETAEGQRGWSEGSVRTSDCRGRAS